MIWTTKNFSMFTITLTWKRKLKKEAQNKAVDPFPQIVHSTDIYWGSSYTWRATFHSRLLSNSYEHVRSEENGSKSFEKYLSIFFFFFKYTLIFLLGFIVNHSRKGKLFFEFFFSSDVIKKAKVFIFLKLALNVLLNFYWNNVWYSSV